MAKQIPYNLHNCFLFKGKFLHIFLLGWINIQGRKRRMSQDMHTLLPFKGKRLRSHGAHTKT